MIGGLQANMVIAAHSLYGIILRLFTILTISFHNQDRNYCLHWRYKESLVLMLSKSIFSLHCLTTQTVHTKCTLLSADTVASFPTLLLIWPFFIFPSPSEPFLGSFTRILIAVVKFISLPSDSCLLAFVNWVDSLSSFPNRQVFTT